MLDVSVKTLDGNNRAYSLPDEITVKQFKDKISESINISPDRQRLIFQGRVLQDDKKLSEYNVNGKVIHVVERPPPDMRRTSGAGAGTGTDRQRRSGRGAPPGGMSIGAFSIPEMVDPNHIQNLVQQTLSGMGDLGRNARVTSRTSSDGSAVDVHINLTRNGAVVNSESQQRILHAHRLLAHINYTLQQLENPPTGESAPPMYEANGTAPVDPDLATPISMSPPSGPGASPTADVASTTTTSSTSTMTSSKSTTSPTSSAAASTSSETSVTSTTSSAQVTSVPTRSAPASSSSSAEVTPQPQRSAPASSSNNSSSSAEVSSQPQRSATAEASSSTDGAPASRNEDHPPTKRLCQLLDELADVERRLEPYKQRYYRLMTDDPELEDQAARNDSQRLYNYVSSCLHHLGHVYHHVSDLMVDFSAPRPRRLRAAANPPPAPTAVIHQTIPVQAQVSLISARPIRSARSRSRGRGANGTANQNPQVTASTVPLTSAQSSTSTTPTSASATRTSTSTSSTSTSTTIPPLGGAFPLGGGAIPPYMFMELGPNSVSVNSISTHLVRDGEDVPPMESLPPFSQGVPFAFPPPPVGPRPGAPPPDLMSNLMRIAQQAQGLGPRGPVAPPPAPSTTPAPASGSATPTSGGQTPPEPSSGQPRVPPIIQMDNRSVDPFMICNSRHYQPMRQHPQRQNGEAAVNEVVSSLISSLVQGNNASTTSGATSATSTTSSTGGAATGAGRVTGTTGAQLGPGANPFAGLFSASQNASEVNQANFAESLRDLLAQAPAQDAAPPTSTSGPTPMTDQMFVDMVTGITSNLGQMMTGQGQSMTLLDFLNSIDPSHNVAMGEGILNEFYAAVSRQMTLRDLIHLFSGQAAPLSRLRPTLQEFVTQKVLMGEEATEENIDSAVDRLFEEENVQGTIAGICRESGVSVEAGIDFPATVVALLSHQLRTIINIVMTSQDVGDEFGQRLYDQCRAGLHELVVLSRRCLTNGMIGVDQLVRNRVNCVSTSVANPLIRNWLSFTSSANLASLTPHITLSDRDVQHYIVRTRDTESMEVESSSTPQSSSASAAQPESPPTDSEESFEDAISSMDASDARTISECSMEAEPTVNGAESAKDETPDWRSVVPREWVPIMTRDAETQRRDGSRQAPFSDAYISGMPAKRRRVMSAENSLVVSGDRSVPAVVQSSIRDAMRQTGIRPLTSVDSLQRDLAANTRTLTLAYQDQVIDDVQRRLENEEDYNSGRFPHTNKYFLGKKK